MQKSDLLTAKEVMSKLRISRDTLQRWIRENRLPPRVKIGSRNLWKASDIEDYLESKIQRNIVNY